MSQVNQQEFLDAAGRRLQADRSEVSWVTLPGGPALLGYRRAFRPQWVFSLLFTFTFVTAGPVASARGLDLFARDAVQHALTRKGHLLGRHVKIGVLAVLGAERVEPEAVHFARSSVVRSSGAFAWPVVVDLPTGTSESHQGPMLEGLVFDRWMRKRTAAVVGDGSVPTTRG